MKKKELDNKLKNGKFDRFIVFIVIIIIVRN